jgi:hypothetical protein
MDYDASFYNARWWVTHDGRLLGAYGANTLRSYVFPLYTPAGVLVLQEAPPDHPHHQGVFVGLEIDGYDLWNAGSFGLPPHPQELDRPLEEWQPTVTDDGVRWQHQTLWRSVAGVELAREERCVSIGASPHGTVVRWRSSWRAAGASCHIGHTKEAGIGLRVAPHWETRWGGTIRNDRGAIGEQACFDQPSRWLNIEGAAGAGHTAGVVLFAPSHGEQCPWFTRDYGLHTYNPARHHPITLEASDTLQWEARVLAYDGARTVEEIDAMVAALDG